VRIRSTKPEFWRSERIAAVEWEDRLVLKGLESYVDDNGVGKDDIALIVGEVFPRDMLANPSETVAKVSEAISRLHKAGLLWRYVVNGTRLLYISFWESIQRIDKPGKGRHCRPDGTTEYNESQIRESVSNAPETVVPGTEEQRNRGTEELLAAQAPTKPKRGQRIAPEWRPSDLTKSWARQNFPQLDLNDQFDAFMCHWQSSSGQNARKLDWDMAFKNWLRNARARPGRNGSSTADLRVVQTQALKNQPSRMELE
jgi:hypothetical protein